MQQVRVSSGWERVEGQFSKVAQSLAASRNIRCLFATITNFTKFTTWCYNEDMKRATMTFPDDLAEAVENYVRAQETPPALTTVMQAALREYLRERGFLRTYRPLKITPVGRSGRSDVSVNHDLYLTGMKK